jgi:hypothetical protein
LRKLSKNPTNDGTQAHENARHFQGSVDTLAQIASDPEDIGISFEKERKKK